MAALITEILLYMPKGDRSRVIEGAKEAVLGQRSLAEPSSNDPFDYLWKLEEVLDALPPKPPR